MVLSLSPSLSLSLSPYVSLVNSFPLSNSHLFSLFFFTTHKLKADFFLLDKHYLDFSKEKKRNKIGRARREESEREKMVRQKELV